MALVLQKLQQQTITPGKEVLLLSFQPIDRSSWPREPYSLHYHEAVPCFYSLTVKLDITALRAQNAKVYPTLLYLLTALVNRHPEFRTAFSSSGELGVYDQMHPSYTVFHPESKTFSNLWTRWSPDYPSFLADFNADQAQYGRCPEFFPKPGQPENVFTVSMLPWISFDGFNLNLPRGGDYLLPIFTIGRFFQEGDRCLLPLAVQVHHAVCDGFHLSRFLTQLQQELDRFSPHPAS